MYWEWYTDKINLIRIYQIHYLPFWQPFPSTARYYYMERGFTFDTAAEKQSD